VPIQARRVLAWTSRRPLAREPLRVAA